MVSLFEGAWKWHLFDNLLERLVFLGHRSSRQIGLKNGWA
jgi:hypothetical protein